MMKVKKICKRLCLTNWGGVEHEIILFNEYVNLFSGKSGSGKSTAMDALQVILYGSVSNHFLNRAADDNKNKRSVFGYLRGEQKDGSANRAQKDFCSVIALEIEDLSNQTYACVGINFEVRSQDTELKKFVYFSHAGKMPEAGYVTAEGVPFTNAQMRKFVESREENHGGRGGEINRIYQSKEAYVTNLYQKLLGYIDGNRFTTMEKSAIALRMTDGTGQFIKDYMFPKGTGDAIEKLSEQLGAYRDICEKITDMKQKIQLLTNIQQAGIALTKAEADEMRYKNLLRSLEMEDHRNHIMGWRARKQELEVEKTRLEEEGKVLQERENMVSNQWASAKADLQSSDLGRKKEHLEELKRRSQMLAANSKQWRGITEGLLQWGADSYVNDYMSQQLRQRIHTFVSESVTEEACVRLHEQILEEKEQLEQEIGLLQEEQRERKKQLEEKRRIVEDMKQNRKSYGENLRKARKELEQRIQFRYGVDAKVYIFADLFDVKDSDWKKAIEGSLGKMRFALVTAPKYAEEASQQFRKLTRYENVDLIQTAAITETSAQVKDHSLYESVVCKDDYVDQCLRFYLGRIIKCETAEELVAAGRGITKDCYAYQNFSFRHLRKKDYEQSYIGTKISKSKLGMLEEDLYDLEEDYQKGNVQITHLKQIYNYETLQGEPSWYVTLAKAGEELEKTLAQVKEENTLVQQLERGEFQEIQKREAQLQTDLQTVRKEMRHFHQNINQMTAEISALQTDINGRERELADLSMGYVESQELRAEILKELEQVGADTLKRRYQSKMYQCREAAERALEERSHARQVYISTYPNTEFTGVERNNSAYDEKLLDYQKNYEPQYEEAFSKQCKVIYKSLRDNVIAKIHGDMKGAHRHKREINRLLRDTNFADSRYQIDIEAAQNADGQFYEMLMAKELDTKNPDNDGFDGQMSLGEDEFYQKYETQIQALLEKFMPAKNADDMQLKKHQEEMEKYADYRTYLSFRMNEIVTDAEGNILRKNYVDDMAGRDSGGEGQNPKYVALLAGFAMLYMAQTNTDSKIKLVLLDEAFSKMDQERSAVCLQYARKMDLQLIVCVPDERLQSLIRNVDSVYGFRRKNNRISMMHIDKGAYLSYME